MKLTLKNKSLYLSLLMLTLLPSYVFSQANICENIKLIAHRGGVVDLNHIENSRAAAVTAIERGYWMIEIDIWETGDGRLILHHDRDFKRYYNDPSQVAEMDWEEIKQLRSDVDGSRPILFEEIIELTKGKVNLMLDIKGGYLSDSTYKKIEKKLKDHDVLSSTFLLGRARVMSYFIEGESFHSIGFEELMEDVSTGIDVSNRFLFEQGRHLNQEKIDAARKYGIIAVAGINEFRYEQMGEDPWEGGKKDIERLLSKGVEYYQIDSVYDSLFRCK